MHIYYVTVSVGLDSGLSLLLGPLFQIPQAAIKMLVQAAVSSQLGKIYLQIHMVVGKIQFHTAY